MSSARSYETHKLVRFAFVVLICLFGWCDSTRAQQSPSRVEPEVNDSHFHLTNYIQEGTDIHKFLEIMGTKVGRVALFGIPLQQQWSFRNSGERRANLLSRVRRTALLLLIH